MKAGLITSARQPVYTGDKLKCKYIVLAQLNEKNQGISRFYMGVIWQQFLSVINIKCHVLDTVYIGGFTIEYYLKV